MTQVAAHQVSACFSLTKKTFTWVEETFSLVKETFTSVKEKVFLTEKTSYLVKETFCYISFDIPPPAEPSIHLIFEGDTAGLEPGEYIPSYLDTGFYTCNLNISVVYLDSLLQHRWGYTKIEIHKD